MYVCMYAWRENNECEYIKFALYSENTTFASKEDISNIVSFLVCIS